MGGVKNIWESNIYYYITSYAFIISFLQKQPTPRKVKCFLRISLGNVNASVVACRYPQIYIFSFRKEFLETLCKCIYLEF